MEAFERAKKESESAIESFRAAAKQFEIDSDFKNAVEAWRYLAELTCLTEDDQEILRMCQLKLECTVDGMFDKHKYAKWLIRVEKLEEAIEILQHLRENSLELSLCQLTSGVDVTIPELENEWRFLTKIMSAIEKKDWDEFTNAVFWFDQIKEITTQQAGLLLRLKNRIPRIGRKTDAARLMCAEKFEEAIEILQKLGETSLDLSLCQLACGVHVCNPESESELKFLAQIISAIEKYDFKELKNVCIRGWKNGMLTLERSYALRVLKNKLIGAQNGLVECDDA